jgi:hypothetical protein
LFWFVLAVLTHFETTETNRSVLKPKKQHSGDFKPTLRAHINAKIFNFGQNITLLGQSLMVFGQKKHYQSLTQETVNRT